MNALRSSPIQIGLVLGGMLFTFFLLLMSIPKSWEEATKVGEDGVVTLADEWAETIEKKTEKYEQHNLYMLVAAQDGYFLCKHCPAGKFYLREREIYRFGTTGVGQKGRGYNEEWLENNKLSYIHLLTADLATVRKKETILIGNYALHPENLRRPMTNSSMAKPYWYRLVIPAGNNSLD